MCCGRSQHLYRTRPTGVRHGGEFMPTASLCKRRTRSVDAIKLRAKRVQQPVEYVDFARAHTPTQNSREYMIIILDEIHYPTNVVYVSKSTGNSIVPKPFSNACSEQFCLF